MMQLKSRGLGVLGGGKPSLNPYFKLFLVVAAVLAVNYVSVKQHENVHKQIYKNFNTESEVYISPLGFLGGYTLASETNFSAAEKIAVEQLHSFNEIIGYPLQMIIVLLTLLLMTVVLK